VLSTCRKQLDCNLGITGVLVEKKSHQFARGVVELASDSFVVTVTRHSRSICYARLTGSCGSDLVQQVFVGRFSSGESMRRTRHRFSGRPQTTGDPLFSQVDAVVKRAHGRERRTEAPLTAGVAETTVPARRWLSLPSHAKPSLSTLMIPTIQR